MKTPRFIFGVLLVAAAAAASAQDLTDGGVMANIKDKTAAQKTAAAAQTKAAQAAVPRRGYLVPPLNSPDADEFRHLVGMLMVRHSDIGAGPEHIGALIGEPCIMVPSGCVALIEPLHDWIIDDGNKTDPYVYEMLDKVLNIVGDRYHSLAALNQVESSFVLLDGWPQYKGPGASFAAQDSIRRMLTSTASISFDPYDLHVDPDAKGPNAKLSEVGAEVAGLYDDAPAMRLSEPLRALVSSPDPGTAVAALKSVGRLERTQATLDLIHPLLIGADGLPRRDVPAQVQIEALNQTGVIAWQLWHQHWNEAARPYRRSVQSLGQDALGDGVAGGYKGNHDVEAAADAAFRSFPRPPNEEPVELSRP